MFCPQDFVVSGSVYHWSLILSVVLYLSTLAKLRGSCFAWIVLVVVLEERVPEEDPWDPEGKPLFEKIKISPVRDLA